LDRQISSLENFIRKQFLQAEYIIVKDIASSLKEDRRVLNKLREKDRKEDIVYKTVKHLYPIHFQLFLEPPLLPLPLNPSHRIANHRRGEFLNRLLCK